MYNEVAKNYYQILELLGRTPAKNVDLGSMKVRSLIAQLVSFASRLITLSRVVLYTYGHRMSAWERSTFDSSKGPFMS